MRMLDLFAGRLGWSKAFLARGWDVTAIDLVEPPEIPQGVRFIQRDILSIPGMYDEEIGYEPFDFICASSPCEEFSVHGMKHFHPNPKYPENGIRLFNHTREICEASGVPYVMENVRAAQQFVGRAVHHCGPFYLWGTGVPAILNQGVTKGFRHKEMFAHDRTNRTHASATIPPELANCVAEYAERLLEQVTPFSLRS